MISVEILEPRAVAASVATTHVPVGAHGVAIRGEKGEPFRYEDFTPEQLEALRGPRGERGETGPAGKDSDVPGPQGEPGRDGKDGVDGKDSTVPGPRGEQGPKGDPFRYSDFTSEQLESLRGPRGFQGEPGKDGKTPVKGVDYFDGAPGKDGTMSFEELTDEQRESLRGPQGERGPEGPQGPAGADSTVPGPPGPKGDDAAATDVQIAGTSITVDGVANIPLAAASNAGAFQLYNNNEAYGLIADASRGVYIRQAPNATIDARENRYCPVTANNLDYAVKAALADGKGAAWSDTEKAAARSRIGVPDAVTDAHINDLIDAKLGAIENGTY